MLKLTRKVDEAVILRLPNDLQIDIAVTGLKGNQVSIGLDTDKEVEVVRDELLNGD